MKKRSTQKSFFKREKSEYGGDLLRTRAGRKRARPLSTKFTMHLVLRSTKAKGAKSFIRHRKFIDETLTKFANKYGVAIVSSGNAGNHLHLQIKLATRYSYKPFIRAVTGVIAMKIGGVSRWTKGESKQVSGIYEDSRIQSKRFWDRRPFTRIVESFKAYSNLKNYVRVNELEGFGKSRIFARMEVAIENTKRDLQKAIATMSRQSLVRI